MIQQETSKRYFIKFLRFMKLLLSNQLIVQLILSLMVLIYALVGAVVFKFLEGREANKTDYGPLNLCLDDVMFEIENGAKNHLTKEKIHKCMEMKPENIPDWGLRSAILFSVSIITTIGYGHVAPRTTGGRAFCIIYALIFVPITMLYLANLGQHLNKAVTRLYIYVRNKYRECTKSEAKILEHKYTIKMAFPIIFGLYLIIGGVMFPFFDEGDVQNFGAAFYFSFITLSTIGLGDITVKQMILPVLIYTFIGLTLSSMAIEILGEYLQKLHYFGRELLSKDIKDIEIWFGNKKVQLCTFMDTYAEKNGLPPPDLSELASIATACVECGKSRPEQKPIPESAIPSEPSPPSFKRVQIDMESQEPSESAPEPVVQLVSETEPEEELIFNTDEPEPEVEEIPEPAAELDPETESESSKSAKGDIWNPDTTIVERRRKVPGKAAFKHDPKSRYELFQQEWAKHAAPGERRSETAKRDSV